MKFLVILSCALVAASATYVPSSYYGYHIPVIGPGGVPVETPEVQAAKANHLAAHAARSGVVHPVAAYTGHHYGVPAIAPDGTPLDTPEVAHAKANHFAAHASRGGYYGSPYAVSSVGPVDTPEVQHAKAAHFAAHAEASARNGLVAHYRKRRSIYGYHVPVIGPNGVPVETPEVQAAKAHHFAAHAAASTRSAIGAPFVAHAYNGYPYHVPLIGPGGHPVETPEVQAAKAHHFAAHAEASTRNGAYSPVLYSGHHVAAPWAYGIQANGAPLDTPEVHAAKIAHFAAHAAVRGHL